MTYRETIAYLYNAMPAFHQVGGAAYKPGPDNILALLGELGNPHTRVRTIHIAGTNGKGSTSHLIAAALQAAGYRTGLYTSPHLVDFRERIRINGRMIPETEVTAWVEQQRTFLDRLQPSFFEMSFGMAMDYFAREEVDIAVIETGLGGRLDATNVISPLLSVITNIGMDHTEFLGNTLPQIAREKAGIIKPGTPCVIGESHPATMNVFLKRAQECDAPIYFADQHEYLRRTRMRYAPECELHGLYQEQNLQTAFVALYALRNLRIFQFSNLQIAEGFAHVCTMTGLRGRWEVLKDKPLVICDTGHNSHGISYVARQLKELNNPHIWIVFGMVNDKDTEVVMRLLPDDNQSPITNHHYHYIFTRPNTHRARTAEEMLALWGREGAIAIEDPREAMRYAMEHAAPEDAIFIGGSNYLVGQLLSTFDQRPTTND